MGWREGFGGNKRSCELFRDTSRGFLKRREEGCAEGGGSRPSGRLFQNGGFSISSETSVAGETRPLFRRGFLGWLVTPRKTLLTMVSAELFSPHQPPLPLPPCQLVSFLSFVC